MFGEDGAIFANHATNITNFGRISSAGSTIVEFQDANCVVKNFGLISAPGNALVFTSGGVHTVLNTGTLSAGNSAIENSSITGIDTSPTVGDSLVASISAVTPTSSRISPDRMA